ncbi:hypothetical protein N7493_009345 [Penicillium malachiteum]|uniref:Uncharacterized protein n=1 Tax=Penicillium malachiteum TaxID=1324776 RepID=A0AAD6HF18_9EURO|nr:hypothetical protein N7493_009345 [Penicillium malachiteum]
MAFTGCGGNQDFYCEKIRRIVGGVSIQPSEVKFLDLLKTNYCESIRQGMFSLIRERKYRRSLNHKLCRLGIGRDSMMTRSAILREIKVLGSGGSMVARLKLKEIDGRAPQGVEPAGLI